MKPIIKSFDQFLFEGGWASKFTQNSLITPEVIVKSEEFLLEFASKFNKGRSYSIVPVTPVGSGINYLKDLKEDPDKIYGDIDYLFKIQGLEESKENLKKVYADIVDFIKTTDIPKIEKEESIRESKKSTPKLIVNLDTNNWYQIDLVLAFDTYVTWSEGRMSPAKGYKGFVVGSIYSSLGKILKLSISEKGVKMKTLDDQPVDFSSRKYEAEHLVTRDFENMFSAMAEHFAKMSLSTTHDFENYKKLDNKNLTLQDICDNIKKLFKDLDKMKIFERFPSLEVSNYQQAVKEFVEDFKWRIEKNSSGAKFDKAESESAKASAQKVKMQAAAAKKEVEELMNS